MKNSLLRFSILLVTAFVFTACSQEKLREALKPGNKGKNVPTEETVPVSPTKKAEEPEQESKYASKQLLNGDAPFNSCFGEGKFDGNSWIMFKNDENTQTDAIVCLVDVSSGKTIRNGYIHRNVAWQMSNIPSGTYYLRVYYGNDWNPKKQNACGTTGAFERDEFFSKSDNPKDYLVIENTSSGYTTGTVTLYRVANGNMESEPINEAEFFSP